VRKLEVSLDAGFFQNKDRLTVSWYYHRSDRQLLPDSLPLIPDSVSRFRNVAAVLENRGWEFTLSMNNIDSKHFGWITSLNISFPVNRLLSLAGDVSPYFRRELVVGRSLSTLRAFHYIGISPLTGTYQVADLNGDGKFTDADRVVAGNLDVRCFGGIENAFRWDNWGLDILLEGRIQQGADYQAAIVTANLPGSIASGMYSNQTVDMLDRWRKPGDVARYQLASAGRKASKANSLWVGSDGILTDASFLRLKAISLSYQWPAAKLQRMHLSGLQDISIIIEANNLMTWTPYRSGDPEIQSAVIFPPLKSIVAGLRIRFQARKPAAAVAN